MFTVQSTLYFFCFCVLLICANINFLTYLLTYLLICLLLTNKLIDFLGTVHSLHCMSSADLSRLFCDDDARTRHTLITQTYNSVALIELHWRDLERCLFDSFFPFLVFGVTLITNVKALSSASGHTHGAETMRIIATVQRLPGDIQNSGSREGTESLSVFTAKKIIRFRWATLCTFLRQF